MNRPHRGTIHCIDARVIDQQAWPDNQFIIRLHAPACARNATPGTFVHVRCNPDIPMRRPLSIMRVSSSEGWIEVLYKVVGHGLDALSRAEPGDLVNLLGPVGRGFRPDPARPQAVLIGGGVGIPPLVFLAATLRPAAGRSGLSRFRKPVSLCAGDCAIAAARHPGSRKCLHAATRSAGHRVAAGQQGRTARQLFRLCHRSRPQLARNAQCRRPVSHDDLRLRPDANAARRARTGCQLRSAQSAVCRGVHGLCGRWMRRLRHTGDGRRPAPDEAGLCGRAGIRRRRAI